jgi:hypothetical protein
MPSGLRRLSALLGGRILRTKTHIRRMLLPAACGCTCVRGAGRGLPPDPDLGPTREPKSLPGRVARAGAGRVELVGTETQLDVLPVGLRLTAGAVGRHVQVEAQRGGRVIVQPRKGAGRVRLERLIDRFPPLGELRRIAARRASDLTGVGRSREYAEASTHERGNNEESFHVVLPLSSQFRVSKARG